MQGHEVTFNLGVKADKTAYDNIFTMLVKKINRL